MTTAQNTRVNEMLTNYAGEQVQVEEITGNIYAYGSELAVLRIFAKYQANGSVHNEKARVGYSENLKTWYFSLAM